MKKVKSHNQMLINQAIKLTALGYELEYQRDKLSRLVERGVEPTMDMFRQIDSFNVAKIEFEQLEKEHLALRSKVANEQK